MSDQVTVEVVDTLTVTVEEVSVAEASGVGYNVDIVAEDAQVSVSVSEIDAVVAEHEVVTSVEVDEVDLVMLETVGVFGESGGGDAKYTHTQDVPGTTWIIAHGLGKRPSVTVVDSSNRVVEGDIEYDGLNSVTLYFSSPFSGHAYLN